MRKLIARTYLTADQIEERAHAINLEASALKPSAERSDLVEEARMLRTYADMKRLLAIKRAS
jgi:hypothetical protein